MAVAVAVAVRTVRQEPLQQLESRCLSCACAVPWMLEHQCNSFVLSEDPQKMPEIVVAAAATGPSAPASRCSYCDCLLGSWNGLALALCLRELYQLHHTLTLIYPLGLPFNNRILQSLAVHLYAHAAIAPKSHNIEQASSCTGGCTNMQDLPLRTIDADAACGVRPQAPHLLAARIPATPLCICEPLRELRHSVTGS